MAELGMAWVGIGASAKGFGKSLDNQIGPQLDKSGKSGSKRLGGALTSGLKSAIAPGLAILGTAGVGAFLKDSIGEAREAQKVGAQTEAVIKSTGKAAGLSAKQFGDLATSISLKTGIDDEAIQSGQNMLATFTNITDAAGKNNDIFTQATRVATDLGVATKSGPVQASLLLGKALNDPAKGLSRLTKIGVTFTDEQKNQVAQMVKVGDTAGAQRIILGELTKEFGGSAAAQATAGDKAAVAFGNLKETVGTALLPVVDRFSTAITNDVVPAISEFVTGMQNGAGAGGQVASTLTDIYNAAKPVASAISSVVGAFAGLPGGTQKVLLLAGAALILQSRFSGAIASVQNFGSSATLATAKTFAMRGGALAAGAGLGALAASAGGASTNLGGLATIGAGIATGFAVAGPWGAAIGGAAGVLAVFTSRSQGAANAQNQLDSAGKRVAATLNQQTGAITANTRAVAAKELADNGAFAAGKQMGISLRDILSASLGNTAALKRVSSASDQWADSLARAGQYTEKEEGRLQNLRDAIGATSSSIADQRNKINQVNEAMGKAKDKTVTLQVQTPGLAGALVGLGNFVNAIDRAIARSNKAKGAVGSNAKGTDNWRGGLTMVGEKGPELINLARGAQVIPNHKIGDIGPSSSGPSRGAPVAGAGMSKREFVKVLNGINIKVNGQPARLEIAGA